MLLRTDQKKPNERIGESFFPKEKIQMAKKPVKKYSTS
jgi:hypothetical protein